MASGIWSESARIAWRTLRANRLRSALTILTVGLGAATMALLVSLASSALQTIRSGVDAVGGKDLLFVEKRDAVGVQSEVLTPDDAEALRGRIKGMRELSYIMAMRDQPMLANGKKLDVDVGIGARFPFYVMQETLAGRELDDDDRGRNVVLTEPVAKEFFGAPEAAVGKTVVLWRERYAVVGVTHEKPADGFNMGSISRARAVFITAATGAHTEGIDPNGFILVRDDGMTDHDVEMGTISSILRYRHHGSDDIEFFDMRAFLHSFDVVFAGIRVIVALTAAVSLVIAGTGIMNVMLASIRQRISEIGIRRAVGASEADIRRQFLVEALFIAVLGGTLGSLAGTGLAAVIGTLVHGAVPAWSASPSYIASVVAAISAGTAGLLFGLKPARRASGLLVVDCLRGSLGSS